MFLVEVCDPSEDVKFAYTVNGITVSDFYTPNFFDPTVSAGVRYSYSGAITEPRKVLKGGYLSWFHPTTKHWWQETFFSGSKPTFRDLGVLSGNESIRSQVDRKTPPPASSKGLPATNPLMMAAAKVTQSPRRGDCSSGRGSASADRRDQEQGWRVTKVFAL